MLPYKLLIIDDDETIQFSFKTFLNEKKYNVVYANNGKEGLEKLNNNSPDLVIADYKMPEMTGLEFIKASKIIAPNIPVIIISAFGDDQTRKMFLNEGAFKYVEKPFDIESVLKTIQDATKININKLPQKQNNDDSFIGESNEIKKIFNNISKIANTKVNILIEGESGTGKDLIAKHIHNISNKDEPFISVNCAAIPENLIESELFGYEKGAFTGAESQKPGKFELAKDGTIFLDEIGELNLQIQAKLLRVLQNKSFERIGGTKVIHTNAQIVAATNRSLLKQTKKDQFREDLYYRLSAFPITVPPLRQRGNDIILITNYLIETYCKEFNKEIKVLAKDSIKTIMSYNWPGNVREMQNIISRITLLESSKIITPEILTNYIPHTTEKEPAIFNNITSYSEKELLNLHALEMFKKCNFNKSETAKRLGINYRTLINRLNNK